MAWRRPGDKPLSEPMMVSLLTHICVTRPQWVKRQMYMKQRHVTCAGTAAYLHSYNMKITFSHALTKYETNLTTVSVAACAPPQYKDSLISIGIPIIRIRWFHDHLIFKMGITILRKTVFILRQAVCTNIPDFCYWQSLSGTGISISII